jgi:hypothetical protein
MLHQEALILSAIQSRQDKDQIDYQHHHDSISTDERTQLADIWADLDDNEQGAEMDIHNILSEDTTVFLKKFERTGTVGPLEPVTVQSGSRSHSSLTNRTLKH